MPLIFAPANVQLKILRVASDGKTKKRLESLGIVSGGDIFLIGSGGGSVVCKIKDGRVALSGDLSAKIFVARQ